MKYTREYKGITFDAEPIDGGKIRVTTADGTIVRGKNGRDPSAPETFGSWSAAAGACKRYADPGAPATDPAGQIFFGVDRDPSQIVRRERTGTGERKSKAADLVKAAEDQIAALIVRKMECGAFLATFDDAMAEAKIGLEVARENAAKAKAKIEADKAAESAVKAAVAGKSINVADLSPAAKAAAKAALLAKLALFD